MNKRFGFGCWIAVLVILLSMLSACSLDYSTPMAVTNTPKVGTATADKGGVPVTMTPTVTPIITLAQQATETVVPAATGFSPECTAINWTSDQAKYKIDKGYKIPLADLEKLAGNAYPGIIYFEGDDYGKTEHHVAVVDGGVRTSEGTFKDGDFLFKDGSFWACPSDAETLVSQDEIVATSLWKKWKNLHDEGKTMRVCVYQTTGVTCFEPGNEPNLLDTAVLEAGYHDCDDNTEIVEQTPYGFQKKGDLLTAHAGAANCRTLYVGKLSPEGEVVAVYFTGSRNGFTYLEGGRFFLVNTDAGMEEIQNFVDMTFAGQNLKVEKLSR